MLTFANASTAGTYISQAKSLVDQYPDFQPLYARTARMYREIASTALENETRAPEKPAT